MRAMQQLQDNNFTYLSLILASLLEESLNCTELHHLLFFLHLPSLFLWVHAVFLLLHTEGEGNLPSNQETTF